MTTVRPNQDPENNTPERLPVRWAVILTAAAAVGAVAFALGGPIAAIGTAGAVALAMHQMIA